MSSRAQATTWLLASALIAVGCVAFVFLRFGSTWRVVVVVGALVLGVAGGLGGWVAKRGRAG